MLWQILMLAQNLLAAVFALNERMIAKRFQRATMPLNLLVYFVIAVSGLGYALITNASELRLSAFYDYAAIFVLTGLGIAASNVVSYVVFQYADAAVASLLSTLNIIAVVVFSTLIISEGLTWPEIVGAVVLLASMELILSLRVGQAQHKQLWLAVGLSIVAAVLFGVAMSGEKYLLNSVGITNYLVFGWGFQFVGVVIVTLLFGKVIKANFGLFKIFAFWKLALPASVIRMLSGLLFVVSLVLANNLSLITVVSGLKIILVALLAAYFLKEKEFLSRKLKAAILAAVGIAVIYW